MEAENHSRLKLALAVLTSPTAAFEEIIRRKMLGSALVIVALTGAAAALATLAQARTSGPIQLLVLGKDNPLTWFGLCLLYGLALQYVLRWSRADIDLPTVVTVLGWSQVALLLSMLMLAILTRFFPPGSNSVAASTLSAAILALQLDYVVVVGGGLRSATRLPLIQTVLAYTLVESAVILASNQLVNYRTTLFPESLPGVRSLAISVVSADQTHLIAAGGLGIVLGLWQIGRAREWGKKLTINLTAIGAVIAASALVIYLLILQSTGYYASLLAGQRFYDRGHYNTAADRFAKFLPVSKDNPLLILDIANTYYAAGAAREAMDYYDRFISAIKAARLGADEAPVTAPAYSGIGAALDSEGKYPQAIDRFRKAIKAFPAYRDPWVRMAVTYDRMGNYKLAIDSANHALKTLDSKATPPWVALAEAYTRTGDKAQARAASAKVADLDPISARQIGSDWANAVDQLKSADLKFPLEKEPAPAPKKSKAK